MEPLFLPAEKTFQLFSINFAFGQKTVAPSDRKSFGKSWRGAALSIQTSHIMEKHHGQCFKDNDVRLSVSTLKKREINPSCGFLSSKWPDKMSTEKCHWSKLNGRDNTQRHQRPSRRDFTRPVELNRKTIFRSDSNLKHWAALQVRLTSIMKACVQQ